MTTTTETKSTEPLAPGPDSKPLEGIELAALGIGCFLAGLFAFLFVALLIRSGDMRQELIELRAAVKARDEAKNEQRSERPIVVLLRD
jgi:hypothetical protein